MHRNIARRQLVEAEETVREGRNHIDRQRAVIRRLRNAGRDTTVDQALLETFMALQDQDEFQRDRLKRELDADELNADKPGRPA